MASYDPCSVCHLVGYDLVVVVVLVFFLEKK